MCVSGIQLLLDKYIRNQCDPYEASQVLAWLETTEYNIEHEQLLCQILSEGETTNDAITPALIVNLQQILEQTLNVIQTTVPEKKPLIKMTWLRSVAAIVLFLFVGTLAYSLTQEKKSIDKATLISTKSKKDILPGGNKAILELADGTRLLLDETINGEMVNEDNTRLIKFNGLLTYEKTGKATGERYNTISTPRGGQYQLILSDGSRVWLNAASSLHFPVSFSGNERKVELQGEGYFEVAKDPSRPFKVEVYYPSGKSGTAINVLGTHFNINAYQDEESIKTTILEGAVQLSTQSMARRLNPGEQGSTNGKGALTVSNQVDLNQVIAWKNGFFNFNNTDLKMVMRQLSRWYGVEVVYEGLLPLREFGGEVQRNLNLNQVLLLLETNEVHFRIEDKRIIVAP